jgi:hypothetical protein
MPNKPLTVAERWNLRHKPQPKNETSEAQRAEQNRMRHFLASEGWGIYLKRVGEVVRKCRANILSGDMPADELTLAVCSLKGMQAAILTSYYESGVDIPDAVREMFA